MIKGVIFDLGGTLIQPKDNLRVEERPCAEDVARWLNQKKHIQVETAALADAIVQDRIARFAETLASQRQFLTVDIMTAAFKLAGLPAHPPALTEEATRQFFQREETANIPVAEAIATLKILHRQGFKLGLLSNASDDKLIQRMVNKNGLRPWLSPVFSSAGLGVCKPNAEPFLLIGRRWGLLPAEIAVVGDTLSADIKGAQNAGMRGILATYVPNPANAQHPNIQPDAAIDTLSALPDVLATL